MAVRKAPKQERDIWIWRTGITEVFIQLHCLFRIKQTQCSFFIRSLSNFYQTCQHAINNEQWQNWGLRPPGTGTYIPRILNEAHRKDINKLAELTVHSRADANIRIIFTTVSHSKFDCHYMYHQVQNKFIFAVHNIYFCVPYGSRGEKTVIITLQH